MRLALSKDRYLVHCDSESFIHLSKNSSSYSRSKYTDMRYHWVMDLLDAKSLELAQNHTDKNVSNILTKVVTKKKHVFCCGGVGMETLSFVG